MKIAFYYEYGKIKEIGTGHKYRVNEIGRVLEENGHRVEYMENKILPLSEQDVLVIDHMNSCKELIAYAKSAKIKVVLIDGHQDDVKDVDISISAVVNGGAQYRGMDYMVFPKNNTNDKHLFKSNNTVFVGMGGFDANNIAELALSVLDELGINAIVAKSINHHNIGERFRKAEVFSDHNYYKAMQRCMFGVTNGGLTFFQSMYYGLPTIPVPQYEHQRVYINSASQYCLQSEPNRDIIYEKINIMINDEKYRMGLSTSSPGFVDGKGVDRICDIIEDLGRV